MANEIAVQQNRQAAMAAFRQEFDLREKMLSAFLPSTVTFDKFRSTVMAALQTKPDLLDCSKQSLVKASIEAAELGLSLNPSLGEGDILKVWNGRDKRYDAQFRPRYGGLMKLARQSGDVRMIQAQVVRQGDEFAYEYGLEPRLVHRPRSSSGEVTHAYCVWVLATGEKSFEVMDREQIEAIKRRSSSKNKAGEIVGPWVTDYDEMCRKTVVRRASKYMPRSAENFAKAVAMDNLRDAGHEVELQDGEVVDITGGDDAGEPEAVVREEVVRQKQGQQMAALEQRVTQAPPPVQAPEPQPVTAAPASAPQQTAAQPRRQRAPVVSRIPVPVIQDEDGEVEDWDGWLNLCTAALAKLSPEQRKQWYALNRETVDEAAFQDPQTAAQLMNLCGVVPEEAAPQT